MNNIQDTGIRGYLKWLKQDQPGIYQLAAPRIAKHVPQAFSNHEQSQAMGALMGFADDPTLVDIGVDIPSVSTDVADAADSGPSSPDIVSSISSIIDSISSAYQNKQAADVYRQYSQAQLQRAQMGIEPLKIQSGQYGIPTIAAQAATSFKSGTGLALGALLLIGGLALLSKRR